MRKILSCAGLGCLLSQGIKESQQYDSKKKVVISLTLKMLFHRVVPSRHIHAKILLHAKNS
jgi:hypothetical protein